MCFGFLVLFLEIFESKCHDPKTTKPATFDYKSSRNPKPYTTNTRTLHPNHELWSRWSHRADPVPGARSSGSIPGFSQRQFLVGCKCGDWSSADVSQTAQDAFVGRIVASAPLHRNGAHGFPIASTRGLRAACIHSNFE